MGKGFDPNIMGEKIIKVIKTIFDPEIPVDIYELGLIYDIMINEEFDVKIIMTLTTPNCPVAETLPVDVEEKVKTVAYSVLYMKAIKALQEAMAKIETLETKVKALEEA